MKIVLYNQLQHSNRGALIEYFLEKILFLFQFSTVVCLINKQEEIRLSPHWPPSESLYSENSVHMTMLVTQLFPLLDSHGMISE